jgi:hypothetical protein
MSPEAINAIERNFMSSPLTSISDADVSGLGGHAGPPLRLIPRPPIPDP